MYLVNVAWDYLSVDEYFDNLNDAETFALRMKSAGYRVKLVNAKYKDSI
jgi:hypothetical protein